MIQKIKALIPFRLLRAANRSASDLLNVAAEGERSDTVASCSRRLFSFHPYTRMILAYRMGDVSKVVKMGEGRAFGSYYEHCIRPKCQEMLDVLEGRPSPLFLGSSGVASGQEDPELTDKPKPSPSTTFTEFNDRVLFNFHSSGSYNPAGYTVRSAKVLDAVSGAGIEALSCTRYGYPWDLDEHEDKPKLRQSENAGRQFHHFPDPRDLIRGRESDYVAAYAAELEKLAAEQEVSVIHASSNYLNGLAAARAGAALGIKSVYEMRGLWHLTRCTREPEYGQSEHYRYCELMEIEAARACDFVVVISSALKEWLEQQGIPAEKIEVAPNAIDEKFLASGESVVEPPEHLKGKFVVGFIGSLTCYEGLDLIIEAVARLKADIPNIHLLIVGAGREQKKLQKLARKLGCLDGDEGVVTFAGRVPYETAQAYYEAVDVFPLPRKAFEVCKLVPPLKPWEILARRKALVVSDLKPLTDIVTDRVNGLICETGSAEALAGAIRQIADNPELASTLGDNGREWVLSQPTWEDNGRLYRNIYDQLYLSSSSEAQSSSSATHTDQSLPRA